VCIYKWPGARPGVIRIKKSHLAINEKVADDGVMFLWHFSKVSINDLFSQNKNDYYSTSNAYKGSLRHDFDLLGQIIE
jgi:hypothetical protein